MKKTSSLFIAILLACAVPVVAQNTVEALVGALSGGNAEARQEAFEHARKFGVEAIAPVAALLDAESPATVRAAKIALEKIVSAACWDAAAHAGVKPLITGDTATVSDVQAVLGNQIQVTANDWVKRAETSQALLAAAAKVKNREWLLWLVSYAGGPEALPGLLEFLDKAPESFNAALLAIQSIGATGMSANDFDLVQALVARLPQREGRERVALLNTLGAIGDPAAVPALLDAMQGGPETSTAAMEALGRIGDPKAADALWAAYKNTGSAAAVDAYLKVSEKMKPKEAAKAYRALFAGTRDPRLQCAALSGLGKTPPSRKTLDALCDALEVDRADVCGAAMGALIAMPGNGVTRTLGKRIGKAAPATKCALLEILSERDAEKARAFLDKALKDEDAEVRVEALRLLGGEPDPAYEKTFLDAARTASEEGRPVALQGYLKLAARALAANDTAKAQGMYHTALSIAERDAEKITALEGLTAIADPSTLDILQGMVEQKALYGPMGACALAIADKLQQTNPDTAKEVYGVVLEHTRDRGQGNRAASGLRALGDDVNIAGQSGFITHWQLIGPFAKENFAAACPPESEYKPDAAYPGAGDQKVKWQAYTTEDVMGVTDLDKLFSPKDNVVAYARAEVTVEKTQDILIKMGSDDGIVAWVNGEKVHENDASRGLVIDEDEKPATLLAGKNVVLVKIVQGSGDWSFCVRLVNRSGRPLRFEY